MLANWLKIVLPSIIYCSQSAFIPSRLITDNIIAAYETMHSMQMMWSKTGFIGIKLDMSKDYDWVEWYFLESAMKKMGFADRWFHLVMFCVSSVTYSILIDGELVGLIKPSKGIRQGDPISPYLFLSCAEVLSGLLRQLESRCDNWGTIFSKRPKNQSYFICR